MVESGFLSFEQAITQAKATGRLHLLLGNGFSVACRKDIFSYSALFDRADFSSLSPLAKKSFEVLDTTDFEQVMRQLRNTAILVDLYSPSSNPLAEMFRAHADGLRDVLIRAIAGHHPDSPSEISASEYQACRSFLANFDDVYTVNYDLLLYWTLMQDDLEPWVNRDDGFRTPDTGPEEYVTWEVENTNKQNIFYLHGALHLFDSGVDLQKFTWSNTGIRLTEQIRTALEKGLYPLIVAEGMSEQKKMKIFHSNYLSRTYRSFANIAGAIFIFGHSLSGNDEHIIRLIERPKSKVRQVYVGIHGAPDSDSSCRMMDRAHRMKTRNGRLDVFFYRSAEANVWGH